MSCKIIPVAGKQIARNHIFPCVMVFKHLNIISFNIVISIDRIICCMELFIDRYWKIL